MKVNEILKRACFDINTTFLHFDIIDEEHPKKNIQEQIKMLNELCLCSYFQGYCDKILSDKELKMIEKLNKECF